MRYNSELYCSWNKVVREIAIPCYQDTKKLLAINIVTALSLFSYNWINVLSNESFRLLSDYYYIVTLISQCVMVN